MQMTTFPQGQHILPRFFLDGFAFDGSKGSRQIHVFRKGSKPFTSSIVDTAKQRFFYARPEGPDTEAALSKEEGVLAEFVQELRHLDGPVGRSDNKACIDLAVHLASRTNHYRAGITDALRRIWEPMADFLEVNRLQARVEKMDPEELHAAIQLWLDQEEPDVGKREQLAAGMAELLLDPQSQFWEALKHLPANMRSLGVADLVRTSHNESLREQRGRSDWYAKTDRWTWRVCRGGDGLFILGDFGPIATKTSHPGAMGALLVADNLGGLVLPISHARVLVGYDATLLPEGPMMSLDDFSMAIARLSREFFCSFLNEERERALSQQIGAQGNLISRSFMDALEKNLHSSKG